MSVSPETGPDDAIDPTLPSDAPGRHDVTPDEATPPGVGADEAQADIETAQPARKAGGPDE